MRTQPLRLLVVTLAVIASAAARAEEKAALKLAIKQGQTYTMVSTSTQDIKQTADGRETKTHQETTRAFSLKVNSVDGAGVMDADLTTKYILVAISDGVQNVDFDSRKPTKEVPIPFRGFSALVGTTLNLKIDAGGNVLDVKGMEELQKKMADSIPDGPRKESTVKMMVQQTNANTMKQFFTSTAVSFADHPVGVGDAWTVKQTVSAGFPVFVETTYTVASIEGANVTLTMKSTLASDAKAAGEIGSDKTVVDVKGEQTGTIIIDMATGWVQSWKTDQHLSGSLTIDPDNRAIKIPIDSTIKIAAAPEK